jgi:hypothetical protein
MGVALFVALAGGVVAGCTSGDLGDPPNPVDVPQTADCGGGINPGAAPMRRLTRTEYDNTIRDLLGDTSNPAADMVPEAQSLGFDDQATSLAVSKLLAEQYLDAAENIAIRATRDMPTLLKCDVTVTGQDACAAQFIADFGARAFRRPLDEATTTRLTNLYTTAKPTFGFQSAIQLVIEAVLQSPHFLYRVEFGTTTEVSAGVVQLDDYEMASRLSFMLWNSMPDDALFAAAAAGELETADQIAAQATRMLDDPRAHDAVENFHTQWLGLDDIDTVTKDAEYVSPRWTPALIPLMKRETQAFLDYVVFQGQGDVTEMLTASYSLVDEELASFYGVRGVTGESFVKVDLDPTERAGFVTQPSIMTINAKPDTSSPILRGKFVRERLLCQPLPPPPNNLIITPPQVTAGVSTRELYAEHSADSSCATCHHLMDPIGFGFENYDAVGAYRTTDQGLPVDASGDVYDSGDCDGPFVGAVQLAQRLAGSEDVKNCVATQWFRFAYGRGETPNECSLVQLQGAFKASNYSIRSLLVALTQTDAFRYRPVVTPGE